MVVSGVRGGLPCVGTCLAVPDRATARPLVRGDRERLVDVDRVLGSSRSPTLVRPRSLKPAPMEIRIEYRDGGIPESGHCAESGVGRRRRLLRRVDDRVDRCAGASNLIHLIYGSEAPSQAQRSLLPGGIGG